jgi:hypothetical protein
MADELAVKNLPRHIHQLEDHGVSHGVINRCAFFARVHKIAISQPRKLLRNGGLVSAQQRLEFIHASFTRAQVIQDRQPRWMRQRFEELGFEFVDRLIHALTFVC